MPRQNFYAGIQVRPKHFRTLFVFLTTALSILPFCLSTGMAQEVKPLGGSGGPMVEVDCNRERSKKVELKFNDSIAWFTVVNCLCDDNPADLKSQMNSIIYSLKQKLSDENRDSAQIEAHIAKIYEHIRKGDNFILRFDSTMTTRDKSLSCYPKSAFDKIAQWAREIAASQ